MRRVDDGNRKREIKREKIRVVRGGEENRIGLCTVKFNAVESERK